MPTKEEIEKWFTHGPDSPENNAKFTSLHAAGRAFALAILEAVPAGPEAQRALERVEEAVMWGNTGISRGR